MAKQYVTEAQRKFAEPDEYGRVFPFAVYVQADRGEYVIRNLKLADAERIAARHEADGYRVHVSLDTCG